MLLKPISLRSYLLNIVLLKCSGLRCTFSKLKKYKVHFMLDNHPWLSWKTFPCTVLSLSYVQSSHERKKTTWKSSSLSVYWPGWNYGTGTGSERLWFLRCPATESVAVASTVAAIAVAAVVLSALNQLIILNKNEKRALTHCYHTKIELNRPNILKNI